MILAAIALSALTVTDCPTPNVPENWDTLGWEIEWVLPPDPECLLDAQITLADTLADVETTWSDAYLTACLTYEETDAKRALALLNADAAATTAAANALAAMIDQVSECEEAP